MTLKYTSETHTSIGTELHTRQTIDTELQTIHRVIIYRLHNKQLAVTDNAQVHVIIIILLQQSRDTLSCLPMNTTCMHTHNRSTACLLCSGGAFFQFLLPEGLCKVAEFLLVRVAAARRRLRLEGMVDRKRGRGLEWHPVAVACAQERGREGWREAGREP